jgi:two-component system, cell cycle response regulator
MSKKVLTVDDSKTLRMIIGKHLAPLGVQMLEAENGEQCLASARQNAPDLILLDYNMPVMDGYHTLVELKADPALKSIPIVMLTTETVKETVIKLLRLGLKDYIAKPFTREVLLEKLNPILSLYDANGGIPEKNIDGIQESITKPDNPTILAVDDKSNILEMLKEYLLSQFNIIAADSGRAAVNAVGLKIFDYLVLDLSMPEVNGFKVLDAYLQNGKKNPNVSRVIAMTLRTAQEDIDRAIGAGISVFLYKPFSREDAIRSIDCVVSQQKEEEAPNQGYLSARGKVRILECPSEKSPRLKAVVGALRSEIVQEIDDMAEEGLSQLIIKVGDGFLSDSGVKRKFVSLVEHVLHLSLNLKIVPDSQEVHDELKQFAETASIPTEKSLEFAIKAFERAESKTAAI